MREINFVNVFLLLFYCGLVFFWAGRRAALHKTQLLMIFLQNLENQVNHEDQINLSPN